MSCKPEAGRLLVICSQVDITPGTAASCRSGPWQSIMPMSLCTANTLNAIAGASDSVTRSNLRLAKYCDSAHRLSIDKIAIAAQGAHQSLSNRIALAAVAMYETGTEEPSHLCNLD